MHEIIFADAFRPPKVKVLNLSLLDYTIGHELLLWQRRNSLVTYSPESFKELPEDERAQSLVQAVLICCEKLPRFKKIWATRCAYLNLEAKTEMFNVYRFGAMRDLPTVAMPKSPGVPYHYFGSPEMARLLNYVATNHGAMIQTHFQGSPLNFPLGMAKMLYTAQNESEGNVWVENWQDLEVKKKKEAYEKANPESTLAVGADAVRARAEKWNREHPDAQVPVE